MHLSCRFLNRTCCALLLRLSFYVGVLFYTPLRAWPIIPYFGNGSSHTTSSKRFTLRCGNLAIGGSPPAQKKDVLGVLKHVRQQPFHAVQNNTRYLGHFSSALEHLFHMLIRKIGYEFQYLLCRGVPREWGFSCHFPCNSQWVKGLGWQAQRPTYALVGTNASLIYCHDIRLPPFKFHKFDFSC